jgi:hypothetical protein
MTRTGKKSQQCAIAFSLVLGSSVVAGCGGVEMEAGYPDGVGVGVDGDYPSDAYIATTEPFYFNGYASYWYGGRWYYQNGGRWNHYDREPAGLYQQRMQGAQRRRTYESHPAGRSYGRGGGRRSGGHR